MNVSVSESELARADLSRDGSHDRKTPLLLSRVGSQDSKATPLSRLGSQDSKAALLSRLGSQVSTPLLSRRSSQISPQLLRKDSLQLGKTEIGDFHAREGPQESISAPLSREGSQVSKTHLTRESSHVSTQLMRRESSQLNKTEVLRRDSGQLNEKGILDIEDSLAREGLQDSKLAPLGREGSLVSTELFRREESQVNETHLRRGSSQVSTQLTRRESSQLSKTGILDINSYAREGPQESESAPLSRKGSQVSTALLNKTGSLDIEDSYAREGPQESKSAHLSRKGSQVSTALLRKESSQGSTHIPLPETLNKARFGTPSLLLSPRMPIESPHSTRRNPSEEERIERRESAESEEERIESREATESEEEVPSSANKAKSMFQLRHAAAIARATLNFRNAVALSKARGRLRPLPLTKKMFIARKESLPSMRRTRTEEERTESREAKDSEGELSGSEEHKSSSRALSKSSSGKDIFPFKDHPFYFHKCSFHGCSNSVYNSCSGTVGNRTPSPPHSFTRPEGTIHLQGSMEISEMPSSISGTNFTPPFYMNKYNNPGYGEAMVLGPSERQMREKRIAMREAERRRRLEELKRKRPPLDRIPKFREAFPQRSSHTNPVDCETQKFVNATWNKAQHSINEFPATTYPSQARIGQNPSQARIGQNPSQARIGQNPSQVSIRRNPSQVRIRQNESSRGSYSSPSSSYGSSTMPAFENKRRLSEPYNGSPYGHLNSPSSVRSRNRRGRSGRGRNYDYDVVGEIFLNR